MRKIIAILCLSWIAVFSYGCSGQWKPGDSSATPDVKLLPPMPMLDVAGVPVPVRLGTYTWSERGRGVAVDAVDPPSLVESLEPVNVRPNAVLNVSFTDAPEEIQVGIWKEGGVDFKKVSAGQVKLPSDEGEYVYVLVASWPQGDASYAFPIRVSRLLE